MAKEEKVEEPKVKKPEFKTKAEYCIARQKELNRK